MFRKTHGSAFSSLEKVFCLQNLHEKIFYLKRTKIVIYEDKSGDVIYSFSCQQIPLKDQNQHWIDPTNKNIMSRFH